MGKNMKNEMKGKVEAGGSKERIGFKENVNRETRAAQTDLEIGIVGVMPVSQLSQTGVQITSELASSSEERFGRVSYIKPKFLTT